MFRAPTPMKRAFVLPMLALIFAGTPLCTGPGGLHAQIQRPINTWNWVEGTASSAPSVAFVQPGFDMVAVCGETDEYTIGESMDSFAQKRTVFPFSMNRYETTYQFWHTVRRRAEKELGYQFLQPGQEGSKGRRGKTPSKKGQYLPVTNITWYDAIVWCNALSELEGFTPCYTYNGMVLRDSNDTARCDVARCDFSADGYRLPTETEWEYAARKTSSGFLPGTAISGACHNPEKVSETQQVGTARSIFVANAAPGTGIPNAGGLFDMSGNVLEFCWDWFARYDAVPLSARAAGPAWGSERVSRGGSYSPYAQFCECGTRYSYDPNESYSYMGFRIAQTVTPPPAESGLPGASSEADGTAPQE